MLLVSIIVFSQIFSPQGKYLFEFFVIKSEDGYFIECSEDFVDELLEFLEKYKFKSDVSVKNISDEYVVGIISNEKFEEIKKMKISFHKL